ncbi:hypothetical protein ABZ128_33170 [Streptomyces sp. NPDC006326]|uniref:hypothetical protein n=1 Tax=Streptomyces sp. NPDC006326 TaxID=3156752 RepID=UPI0033A03869
MHRIAQVAVLVTAAVAFSAPVANADRSYIYNSYSEDVTDWHTGVSWGGALACDMDQDGNSVKAHFTRDDNSSHEAWAQAGNGTCNGGFALSSSNRVKKHRSQQIRDWATDPYGPWKYRP